MKPPGDTQQVGSRSRLRSLGFLCRHVCSGGWKEECWELGRARALRDGAGLLLSSVIFANQRRDGMAAGQEAGRLPSERQQMVSCWLGVPRVSRPGSFWTLKDPVLTSRVQQPLEGSGDGQTGAQEQEGMAGVSLLWPRGRCQESFSSPAEVAWTPVLLALHDPSGVLSTHTPFSFKVIKCSDLTLFQKELVPRQEPASPAIPGDCLQNKHNKKQIIL